MAASVEVVDEIARWVDERKQNGGHLSLFAINLYFNDCFATGPAKGGIRVPDALATAVEEWRALHRVAHVTMSVSIDWHSITGAGFGYPQHIVDDCALLITAISLMIGNDIRVACGVCPVSDRHNFRIWERCENDFAVLTAATLRAVASAMRHRQGVLVFDIDPDTLWATPRREDLGD
jgi:hypothetical protein